MEIPAQIGRALLQPDAGQEGTITAGVIAGSVRSPFRRAVIEPSQDLDRLLARLQRLERAAERNVQPLLLGPPRSRDCSIGKVDEGCTEWSTRWRGRQAAPRRGPGSKHTRLAARNPMPEPRHRRPDRAGNGGGSDPASSGDGICELLSL